MSDIPRYIQQKCEQRWARRFGPRVLASIVPKDAQAVARSALAKTPAGLVVPPYELNQVRPNFNAPESRTMTRNKGKPFNITEVEVETADGAVRVPERANDSGSQSNETADGLDPETEARRHATEDTPSGAVPESIEKTPVFDRGDAAETI